MIQIYLLKNFILKGKFNMQNNWEKLREEEKHSFDFQPMYSFYGFISGSNCADNVFEDASYFALNSVALEDLPKCAQFTGNLYGSNDNYVSSWWFPEAMGLGQ